MNPTIDHKKTALELGALALLLALVAALAWPGMSSPPMLDDKTGLTHAESMNGWGETFGADGFGLFRPVKNIIFLAFHRGGEIDLFAWHGLVLGCYLLAVVSLFVFLRSLLGSPTWALIAAAAWALCPTQVSTAVWMSSANISIAVLFTMIFASIHLRSVRRQERFPWLLIPASLSLFLAQISYETAVCGLGLVFLCDQFLPSPPALMARIRHYAAYGIATVAFLVLRTIGGSATSSYRDGNPGISPDVDNLRLIASAPWFLMKHLQMWLWPTGRVEFLGSYIWGKSASPAELAVAWAVAIGLLAIAWAMRRKSPLVSLGLFWFLVAAGPASNIIPVYAGPVEDYYLVFPGIGLAIAVVGLVQLILARMTGFPEQPLRGWSPAVVILLAAITGWRLFHLPAFALRADLWNRPLELYLDSAATRPQQYLNGALAARELYLLGLDDEALELLRQYEQEEHWYPIYPMTEGFILIRRDRPLEALVFLNQAIGISKVNNPVHHSCRMEVAKVHLFHTQDYPRAREVVIPVIEKGSPEYKAKAIHLLAEVYQAQGATDRAIATLRKGQALFPDDESFREHQRQLAAKTPGGSEKSRPIDQPTSPADAPGPQAAPDRS